MIEKGSVEILGLTALQTKSGPRRYFVLFADDAQEAAIFPRT